MLSYTATIGRNFSDSHPLTGLRGKPMTLSAWERFIKDVEVDMVRTLLGATGDISGLAEVHRGKGEWNGVTEESAKITILMDGAALPRDVHALHSLLSQLAREYGQDAIALTLGHSILL